MRSHNPGNTYSGGTIVSNAVFRLDAVGSAGSGAITASVIQAHIFVNCSKLTNDCYFGTSGVGPLEMCNFIDD